MPLSNAEKVRRYRERQKAKKQQEMNQPTPPSEVFRKPFFEFYPVDQQLDSAYTHSLELAGIQPLLFEDDSGPETATLDDILDDEGQNAAHSFFGSQAGSSLGKAEVLIGCLLNAAADLAGWVSDYKKSEIKARIAEIEAEELPDPEARRAAFARVAELNRLLEELDRTIRWSMPQWKVDLPPGLVDR